MHRIPDCPLVDMQDSYYIVDREVVEADRNVHVTGRLETVKSAMRQLYTALGEVIHCPENPVLGQLVIPFAPQGRFAVKHKLALMSFLRRYRFSMVEDERPSTV